MWFSIKPSTTVAHPVVVNLLKNSQAVKKGAALCKMASMKKSCEIQVAAKKWL